MSVSERLPQGGIMTQSVDKLWGAIDTEDRACIVYIEYEFEILNWIYDYAKNELPMYITQAVISFPFPSSSSYHHASLYHSSDCNSQLLSHHRQVSSSIPFYSLPSCLYSNALHTELPS